MTTLSVIIIAYNEERNIRACLDSVKWADEIIVFDSGSTDNTVKICQEYTDHVYSTDWPGFGIQKNRALAKATQPWVLSIDADERVSKPLQEAILNTIKHPSADGYYLPRQVFFCGQPIRYGDWGNNTVLRLFKRDKGSFTEVPVHETIIVNGSTAALPYPLLHYTIDQLEESLIKMNQYSTLSATRHRQNRKKGGILRGMIHGLAAFLRNYLFKLGFLDGRAGFIIAVLIAEGAYYRYVKIAYSDCGETK